MPASSGDPISAALNHSLAASSKYSSDSDSLDKKIVGSAKKVLLSEIKYEQTSSYNSTVLGLKSKYIVLKPPASLENGDSKLKNGLPKPKVKDVPSEIKTYRPSSPGNSSKACSSTSKPTSPGNCSNKTDAVLPSPKRVLFPQDKIQLGWQSKNFPIGSGMVNLGNTCYLNSTLQALFHVPAFVNWLLNDKAHKDKCETMNGFTHTECLICAMLKTLKNSLENSASANAIRPHHVYNKLKLICKRLMHGHQEDAHEFLRYLIESMERSYLRIMQANNLDSYSKETTPLSQIFGGYLRTEVRCLECRHISLTFQHFQDLLLDIRQVGTLEEALEAYFSLERLGEGEEAYKCDKCHRRVAATKQFTVEKPPNVLCIQLKRFGIMGGKNSKHVQVQQSLDLTRFWVHRAAQPTARLHYRLVSLVSHIGPSANCGHYTAIGLTSSGQFYLFDDSMVRSVSSHAVSGNNTYIIMYELTSPNPSINGIRSKPATTNCTVTKPSAATSVNGYSTFPKCPPSPVTNGNHSSSKTSQSQPTTPLKSMLSSAPSGSPLCAKNGQHKSLVPYSAESSDSESEPTTSKHKASLALVPVKNGFAKESSSSVKFSNCAAPPPPGEVVVNGWHVTAVARRNQPSASCYSPPQSWNVVDTSTAAKNGEKGVASSQLKLAAQHGPVNGRSPLVNGHCEPPPVPEATTNGVNDTRRVSNGKSWDGGRNNSTVDYLRKSSHQGLGQNVSTWNGNRTQVDREAENDRMQQRKRPYDQMYEDDFDQGKVKKIKSHNHFQKNNREMNGRANFFQEHQNHKNNWYNNRSQFYQTYTNNNHYRPYPNHNRSSYHWRR